MKTKLFILLVLFGFPQVYAGMVLTAPNEEDVLLAETSPSLTAIFQIGDAIGHGFGGGTERGMILSGANAETKYCEQYSANCFKAGASFRVVADSSDFKIRITDWIDVSGFAPTFSTDRLLFYIYATLPDTKIEVKNLVFNGLPIPDMSSDVSEGYVWEITGLLGFGQLETSDIISGHIQMFKTGSYTPIDDDLMFKVVGIGDGSLYEAEPSVPEPSTLIIMTGCVVMCFVFRMGSRKNNRALFI